jgi:ABC-type ATPase with predicted acetyltransferase domain
VYGAVRDNAGYQVVYRTATGSNDTPLNYHTLTENIKHFVQRVVRKRTVPTFSQGVAVTRQ